MEHNEDGPVPPVLIGNEFARVRLEVVPASGGDQLRISSIRTNRARMLSAESVEGLSRLQVSRYLEALETPFGPEAELAFSEEFPRVAKEES